MSKAARAGAAALVAAPLIGFASMLVLPTVSDDGHDVVAALTAHHGAMITGLTLQTLSIPLMIAGLLWLVAATRTHAPRLAVAGGIVGVAGALVILFEDGLTAVAPSVVGALDPGQAVTALDHVQSSVAAGIDPLALLFDLGLAMLGFAAVNAGAPRWLAPALTVSALAQGIGFGAGARPLVAVAFVAMTVLLVVIVRSLAATEVAGRARSAVAVA